MGNFNHAGHATSTDIPELPSNHSVEPDAQAHVETSIDPATVEDTPYTEQVPDNRECTSPLAVSNSELRSNVDVICDFASTGGGIEDSAASTDDHEDANDLTAPRTTDFKEVCLS